MRHIKLAIFNEPYWDKGLVYSQNILPLTKLSECREYKISIVSFTSIAKMWMERKQIKVCKQELKDKGIDIIDYPMLFYPTRFMLLRWFMVPLYFVNIYFYIKRLAIKDETEENVIYSVRSYQAALGFYKFYPVHNRIIFDLRTDWIEENINCENFSERSLTAKYWKRKEKSMLESFHMSLFISPLFRDNVLKRNGIAKDTSRYIISYNPIDYNHFQREVRGINCTNFLYTGSLGHWNNIDTYLNFFLTVSDYFPDSHLIVCTGSPQHKVLPFLNNRKYDGIRERVEIYYNVPYGELPKYYARCGYGLQIMNKKDSRVGVKFIEYIAAGITPIVHKNVMGAAKIAEDYKLGITFDDSDYNTPYEFAERIKQHENISIESPNYKRFQQVTDLNNISAKMIEIYG